LPAEAENGGATSRTTRVLAMTAIYLWPTWATIIVVVLGVTVPAVVGHIVTRRIVPYSDLAKHNDVTGFVLAIVGVVYAVLLAFVVIIAWQAFNTADGIAGEEVSAASDLYRLAETFKEPNRGVLRREIVHYAALVQHEEWTAMRTGLESDSARKSAERIEDLTVSMVDGDSVNRTAVDESFMTIVRSLLDARRARLNQNGQGIPDALWDGLFLGAILTIGFTYLFGVENFRIQLMMTGLLAALIGVMFSMIVALNYPYRGAGKVSPEIWQVMIERVESIYPLSSATSIVGNLAQTSSM
jgi:hypothetical protein